MKMGKWNSRWVFSLLSHLSPALVCKHYYGVRGEKIECWDEGKHQGNGTDIPLSVNGELFTGVMFNQGNKDVRYYQNGHIHREDGPAIKTPNGTTSWYVNGKCHRLDGPAVEEADGYRAWYSHGQRHRLDGPAIEWENGDKEWYVHGDLHRTDGPAVEKADGDKYWYENNTLHRLDGPAVQIYTGTKSALSIRTLISFYNLKPFSPDCYTAWYVDGQHIDVLAFFGYRPSVPLTEDEQMILRLSV